MTDEEMAEEYENTQDYCGLLDVLFEEQYNQDYGGLSCYISPYIEQAFLAGLKAGRPKWHKVADGYLPEHEVNVLVLHNVQCIDIAHYNYDYKEWHFIDSIVRDVIAWCEIPKFEDKE